MHANQLAELGSWVATNAGTLVYGETEQPMLVLTNYWTASKVRINRWVTALKMFEEDVKQPKGHDPWPALAIVVQEILVSEFMTRIWAATVLTHDWHRQTDEMQGLAHSVHISHLEAKNRAMRVMLAAKSLDKDTFDRMNVLRSRLERWTDLFLGQLPSAKQAATFAFDKNRVSDFHSEFSESIGRESATQQRILMSSFALDLARDSIEYAANPDINREIAAGVLSCFPADRFDSYGLPKSVRSVWLEKSQSDTQVLVDHLFAFEKSAETRTVVSSKRIG